MNWCKIRIKCPFWCKTIALIVVCLFSFHNVSPALLLNGMHEDISTLQVELMFKPITDIVGRGYKAQLRMEMRLIFAMAMKEGIIPFQDINAALDRCDSADPDRERILDLDTTPYREEDKTIVKLILKNGPNKGKVFMTILSNKPPAGYDFDVLEAVIPEIGEDEVECSAEGFFSTKNFIGDYQAMERNINERISAAVGDSGDREVQVGKSDFLTTLRQRARIDENGKMKVVWTFKKEDAKKVAKILNVPYYEPVQYDLATWIVSKEIVVAKEMATDRPPEEDVSPDIKRVIVNTNQHSKIMIREVEAHLELIQEVIGHKAEDIPVDISIDLSLIPKEDTLSNVQTWAYLILAFRNMKNVNFIFELPSFSGKDAKSSGLETEIANASEQETVLMMLKEELRANKAFSPECDIEDLIDNRINVKKRDQAIEIPIVSKTWLEWVKPEGMALNQYPVALESPLDPERTKGVVSNFQAALTVGYAKAILVMAKRRDDQKEEGKKELPELIRKLLPKLNKLYKVFTDRIEITEQTVVNMIDDDRLQRINRAKELALPPIAVMAVENLRIIHEKIQDILRFA